MINSPIGNNNSAASPHFGVAAPQDISRIDVLYGPFSARYAGNSIGATINITTRMPEQFRTLCRCAPARCRISANMAPTRRCGTWQLAGGVGDRYGAFSWRLSANHLDIHRPALGLCHPDAPGCHQQCGHAADRRLQ